MAKMIIVAAVFLAITAQDAAAQTQGPDNFGSREECLAAVKSGNYRPYEPTIKNPQPLGVGEAILPHPTGACLDMGVPDRIGGRRWVPIEQWRPVITDRRGRMLRLAECDRGNEIYAEARFTVPAPAAPALQPMNGVVELRPGTISGSVDVNHRFPDRLKIEVDQSLLTQRTETTVKTDPPEVRRPGWFRRHWKGLLIGAGIIAATAYVCSATDVDCTPWNDDDEEETDVNVCTVVVVGGLPVRVEDRCEVRVGN